MHFTYTRPGGNWANVSTFDYTDAQSFDQKIFKSINGDDGGVWAPAAAIEIGGAGIAISGTGKLATKSGGRIELGDNDFPQLKVGHTGRSRTLVEVLQTMRSGWTNTDLAVGSPGVTGPGTTASAAFHVPVHNGGTLDRVKIKYAIATGHGALPAVLPTFQVFRRAYGNGAGSALGGTTLTAGNVALYENGGAEQEVTIDCAASVIDSSVYYYYVYITDENGANAQAGNKFRALQASIGNIADMRFA